MEIKLQASADALPKSDSLSGASTSSESQTSGAFQAELGAAMARISDGETSPEIADGDRQTLGHVELTDGNGLPSAVLEGNGLPLQLAAALPSDQAELATNPLASSASANAGHFIEPVTRPMVATKELKPMAANPSTVALPVSARYQSPSVGSPNSSAQIQNQALSGSGVDTPSGLTQALVDGSAKFDATINTSGRAVEGAPVPVRTDGEVAVSTIAISALPMATLTTASQPTSEPLSISVPVGHPAWANAMSEQLTMAIKQNLQSVELKLTPTNLGPLEIQINNQNDGVNITLVSPHAAVRDAMDAAMPKLRELFEQAQLDLGNVDVSDQSLSQSNRDFAQQSQNPESVGDNEGEWVDNVPPQGASPGSLSVGLVDAFV